jgi:hypothetical protein
LVLWKALSELQTARSRGRGAQQAGEVRIEDEVLITNTGYRLLTDQFPRKLEDVEAWVAKARK